MTFLLRNGLFKYSFQRQLCVITTQGASVDPPDKARCTPLFKAAANGGVETVQLLLERGADVTVKSVAQKSVLHAAVRHTEVMQLLLKVCLQ